MQNVILTESACVFVLYLNPVFLGLAALGLEMSNRSYLWAQ